MAYAQNITNRDRDIVITKNDQKTKTLENLLNLSIEELTALRREIVQNGPPQQGEFKGATVTDVQGALVDKFYGKVTLVPSRVSETCYKLGIPQRSSISDNQGYIMCTTYANVNDTAIELGFDKTDDEVTVESAFGVAPLPPIVKDVLRKKEFDVQGRSPLYMHAARVVSSYIRFTGKDWALNVNSDAKMVFSPSVLPTKLLLGLGAMSRISGIRTALSGNSLYDYLCGTKDEGVRRCVLEACSLITFSSQNGAPVVKAKMGGDSFALKKNHGSPTSIKTPVPTTIDPVIALNKLKTTTMTKMGGADFKETNNAYLDGMHLFAPEIDRRIRYHAFMNVPNLSSMKKILILESDPSCAAGFVRLLSDVGFTGVLRFRGLNSTLAFTNLSFSVICELNGGAGQLYDLVVLQKPITNPSLSKTALMSTYYKSLNANILSAVSDWKDSPCLILCPFFEANSEMDFHTHQLKVFDPLEAFPMIVWFNSSKWEKEKKRSKGTPLDACVRSEEGDGKKTKRNASTSSIINRGALTLDIAGDERDPAFIAQEEHYWNIGEVYQLAGYACQCLLQYPSCYVPLSAFLELVKADCAKIVDKLIVRPYRSTFDVLAFSVSEGLSVHVPGVGTIDVLGGIDDCFGEDMKQMANEFLSRLPKNVGNDHVPVNLPVDDTSDTIDIDDVFA